jgi:hypothetical protein
MTIPSDSKTTLYYIIVGKGAAVIVRFKNHLTPISAKPQTVKRTGKFQPPLSGHSLAPSVVLIDAG